MFPSVLCSPLPCLPPFPQVSNIRYPDGSAFPRGAQLPLGSSPRRHAASRCRLRSGNYVYGLRVRSIFCVKSLKKGKQRERRVQMQEEVKKNAGARVLLSVHAWNVFERSRGRSWWVERLSVNVNYTYPLVPTTCYDKLQAIACTAISLVLGVFMM